jgi:hypothetical protein
VAAVAVVAFAGLTLDQGHQGSLRGGSVEVGELVPINVMQMAAVTLPEITVTASHVVGGHREAVEPRQSAMAALAVAAGRAALRETNALGSEHTTSAGVLLN